MSIACASLASMEVDSLSSSLSFPADSMAARKEWPADVVHTECSVSLYLAAFSQKKHTFLSYGDVLERVSRLTSESAGFHLDSSGQDNSLSCLSFTLLSFPM